MVELLNTASEVYQDELSKNEAAVAFLENRGINLELAPKFEIGFSTGKCLNDLIRTNGNDLYSLGLLNDKKQERNRNRLMFPIRDCDGNLIAFNGRAISEAEDIKYLLSPEYAGFFKSQILYNLHHAKDYIKAENNVYLTEGVFDTIAFHSFGKNNAVCALGSDITAEQVRLLSEYTTNFTFAFDGDKTGFKKAYKNAIVIKEVMEQIDANFNSKENIKFLIFSEERDPGDYLKDGDLSSFTEIVSDPKTGIDFIKIKCQNPEYKAIYEKLIKVKEHDENYENIPKWVKARVLSQVDILEVVSDYVELKKVGTAYKSLCPFPDHDENTPSFVVTPSKNICKCFGCDSGGNAISFVAEIEGVTYSKAIQILKDKYDLQGIDDFKETSVPGMNENSKSVHYDRKLFEYSKGLFNYLDDNKIDKRQINQELLATALKQNNFKESDAVKVLDYLVQFESEKYLKYLSLSGGIKHGNYKYAGAGTIER